MIINEKILRFNKNFDKAEVKKFVDWFLRNYGSIRTVKLLDSLKTIGFIHATKAGISIGLGDLLIPPIKKVLVKHSKKTIKNAIAGQEKGKIAILQHLRKEKELWNTNNEILGKSVVENFRQTDMFNPVYMMVFSGARGNLSQVKQLIGMRGFFANSQGLVIDLPIKSNLKEGLNIVEYFTSCYGARKGIIDTALKTADAGYLTRRLVYAGQGQIIKKPNCFSKNAQQILTLKKDKNEYLKTQESLIGRVLARDIKDSKTNKIIVSKGQDICKYLVKKITSKKYIYVRTPLHCKLNTGLCQLCYGWNLATGQLVDLGEAVGIIAAQSIGEPGTQLTMRTFHTGGVYSVSREIIECIRSPQDGIIYYNSKKGGRKLTTKYGEKIFLTLKEKKIIIRENPINKKVFKLPKNSIIFVKPRQKVFKTQMIAQTPDQQSEIEYINNDSVVEAVATPIPGLIDCSNEKHINKTKSDYFKTGKRVWIQPGEIFTYYSLLNQLKNCAKRNIFLNFNYNNKTSKNLKKEFIKPVSALKINYELFKKLPTFNKNYHRTKKTREEYIVTKKFEEKNEIFLGGGNQSWIEISTEHLRPKIKLGERVYRNQKLTNNLRNGPSSKIIQKRHHKLCLIRIAPIFIPNNISVNVTKDEILSPGIIVDGQTFTSERAEDIVQGLPKVEELLEARKISNYTTPEENPHYILEEEFKKLSNKYQNSIAVEKAFEKVQQIIIERVQKVYQSQGVKIADKHLELIVKQMTSRVLITENGDSNLMTGEIMEITRIEKINQKMNNKIKYEPILIGISKLSLSSSSFLSEASFQETTRVLARSAIEGKIDWLYGLRENVILGNLIPAGTGFKRI